MSLPNFLFVGTAKAGTTSIYHYLKQHPQIQIPVKETFFFMKEVLHFDLKYPMQREKSEVILDRESYEKIFCGVEAVSIGEIGTGYLYYHQQCIPLIKEVLGEDVKILIVLRNPIDRAFSSYRHFTKDLHETISMREAFSKEAERKRQGWDFMWFHLELGNYYKQVEAYLRAFKKVKIIIYDDFRAAPETTMKEIFKFLEIEEVELNMETTFNSSGEPKLKTLQKFITHENPVKAVIRPLFRLLVSKEKREHIRKTVKTKNLKKGVGISVEDRLWLKEYYRKEVEQLSVLLQRDLSHWIN